MVKIKIWSQWSQVEPGFSGFLSKLFLTLELNFFSATFSFLLAPLAPDLYFNHLDVELIF
jgi:hypothetical protein